MMLTLVVERKKAMDPNEFAIHAAIEDQHWWFRARRNIIGAALDKYETGSDLKTEAGLRYCI